MSREIRFRAWDGEQMIQDWAYVDYPTPEGWLWLHNPTTMGVKSIMQSTGLKDKNGVEIWEKDYLLPHYNNLEAFVVEFEAGKYNCTGYSMSACEVIGNEFENPELIGKRIVKERYHKWENWKDREQSQINPTTVGKIGG